MNIKKITIQNFRNIENEISFELNPRFTVIIGINGKGKSTILHALRIAAGAYLAGIPEASPRGIYSSTEIRQKFSDSGSFLNLQTPTVVRAEGSVDGVALRKSWERRIPEGKEKSTPNTDDIAEIKAIAKLKYESVTKLGKENIDNPVVAFFGTERLYGRARNTLGTFIGRRVFKYGYANWSEMQYATYQYTYWLNSHSFLVEDKKDLPVTKEAFFNAIRAANPYITALGFDGKELRVKVKLSEHDEESQFFPLSLHSDGIRMQIAMVAELAFRCIMLNAHRGIDAIKKSRGIVMIDEIDLYLHPNWQRRVVDDLKEAFPYIQFVATTHSPFIVQSLKADELIILDEDIKISGDPFRKSIEEVSEDELGVKDVERSTTFKAMQNAAAEFFQLVQNKSDKDAIQKAKVKLDELRLKYNDDPAYVALLESELFTKK